MCVHIHGCCMFVCACACKKDKAEAGKHGIIKFSLSKKGSYKGWEMEEGTFTKKDE